MRVGLYARVSTDIQAREGDSIQAQLSALRSYCEKNKYDIAGEYIDDGISGTLLNERDELQRLLDDVRDQKIDLVAFTRLDRYFRNLKHYLNTQETLDKYGVPWVAIWESYTTATASGRLIINQMLSFAQFECENTSVRIHHVFDYKRQNREVLSGKVPFGYKIENKHLVPDPEKAEIARRAFQAYIDTGNVTMVLRLMEGNGLPTTQTALRNMLHNRRYIGECYGVENYHEAIIDKDTFDTVQEMLKHNVRMPQKMNYIFSGLVICSDCGRRMIGTTNVVRKANAKYKVYQCPGYYRALKACTNTRSLNEAKLEKYLVNNLKNLAFADISVEDKRKANSYERKIASTEKKISRLKELYLNELITLDDYKRDLAAYRADIETFKAEVRKYRGTDKKALYDLVGRNLADWYWTLNEDERKAIWRSVIDKIYYDGDKNIRVVFR